MSSNVNAATSGGLTMTSDTSGILKLQTAGTDAVTITAAQNVGIGTSSPAYRLDVASASGIASQITSGTGGVAALFKNLSSGTSTVEFAGTTTTNNVRIGAFGDVFTLNTGGSERMRIDSSGNLGLGVTPSAWTSSFFAIQCGTYGNSIYGWKSNYGSIVVGSNHYVNSSGTPIYTQTQQAARYVQELGAHRWETATSGTAGNAITWTTPMTLDASGNLGVGVTSPSAKLHVQNQIYVKGTGGGDGSIGVDINSGGSAVTTSAHAIRSGGGAGNSLIIETQTANSSGQILFQTNGSERARIDASGNLLVGTTNVPSASYGGAALCPDTSGRTTLKLGTTTTSSVTLASFWNPNGAVGTIQTNGSATSYVTSSDYRLKENVTPMTGALSVVQQLNPVTYNWKVDGSDGQGFIAHELQAVVPDAVVGAKDATEIQQYEITPAVLATYDEEGNELTPAVEAVMGEREVPVYQGIDTSFLVATLTAAIKEMKEIIDQQSERITALEGAAQ